MVPSPGLQGGLRVPAGAGPSVAGSVPRVPGCASPWPDCSRAFGHPSALPAAPLPELAAWSWTQTGLPPMWDSFLPSLASAPSKPSPRWSLDSPRSRDGRSRGCAGRTLLLGLASLRSELGSARRPPSGRGQVLLTQGEGARCCKLVSSDSHLKRLLVSVLRPDWAPPLLLGRTREPGHSGCCGRGTGRSRGPAEHASVLTSEILCHRLTADSPPPVLVQGLQAAQWRPTVSSP